MIDDSKSIAEQVKEYCILQISQGTWTEGERIPSTKDLAVTLCVNHRTVMKAYDELATMKLIRLHRGQGYTLMSDAKQLLIQIRQDHLLKNLLPSLLKEANECGISTSQLINAIQNFR